VLGLSAAAWVPILVLLAVLATDLWVYTDAKAHSERGAPVIFSAGFLKLDSPTVWFLACLVLWILVFPLYITIRNQLG
jgi:hypothetical protein